MSVITTVLVSVKRVVTRLIRLRLQSIEVQNDKCCDGFLALDKAHLEERRRIGAAHAAAIRAASDQAIRRTEAASKATSQSSAVLSAKTAALETQRKELLAVL